MRGLPRLLSKPWNLLMEVEVERIGQCVNGCSIMGLMMLAAAKGTTIHVKTSGNQAKEVMEALEKLLDNKFGEE